MERGNLSHQCQGKTSSSDPRKRESTNVEHRGGSARSSVEASVMDVEQRGRQDQASQNGTTGNRRILSEQAKPFDIPKSLVMKAWKLVKRNGGAAGVDGISVVMFERNLIKNLYTIWNRMASGSYHPAPVLKVDIPKKSGGTRPLGIPTVADRVAQMTARLCFEPLVEPSFHPDSYGYRPGKSAHQAVAQARKRCWEYDWVIDLDIKGFFDTINHELLLKAVDHFSPPSWVRLYIERWLKAPAETKEKVRTARTLGTPQGGVISPVLANLFLHFAIDLWMSRKHPGNPFERYADDMVIHCRTKAEAEQLLNEIKNRLQECKLTMHPEKTKIVYCRDGKRRQSHEHTKFKFLSFDFQARTARSKSGVLFLGFGPGISKDAETEIKAEIRSWRIHRAADADLERLSKLYNAKLRGWFNYFGKFRVSELYRIFCLFGRNLVKWAMNKFKSIKGSWLKAAAYIKAKALENSHLFIHWEAGWLANGRS
jgi:RNA-directed DNA polymerase